MIYAGEDQFLEAEMQAKKVKLTLSKNKLGLSVKEISWGYNNGEFLIYFASVEH